MPLISFYVGVDKSGHWIGLPIPPANDAQVTDFERRIGSRLLEGRLPEPFRRFLLTANGGTASSSDGKLSVCFESRSHRGTVTHDGVGVGTLDLVSLAEHKDGGASHPSSLWSRQENWLRYGLFPDVQAYYRNVPEDVFPIGSTSSHHCGDEVLLIGIGGQRYGQVYVFQAVSELWSDEMFENPSAKLDAEAFLLPVADDFDGFLAGLHPCRF